jgi:hypothetical protein
MKKNMKNKFYKLCAMITFILAILGLIVFVATTHELNHYFDLKDTSTIEDICIFNIPIENGSNALGYVEYTGKGQSSELSAYFISFLITFILSIFLVYFIINSKYYFDNETH